MEAFVGERSGAPLWQGDISDRRTDFSARASRASGDADLLAHPVLDVPPEDFLKDISNGRCLIRFQQHPARSDTILRKNCFGRTAWRTLGLRDKNQRSESGKFAAESVGHRAGGRQRHPALSAHQGTRQAGRALWREIPHHRFRAQQFHQLRHLFDLRADPVPQPVAAAASERRLAVRRPAEEPVHHPRARADALARRDLVSGHGRRHLPEHQPGRTGRPACGGHLRRRSHLPHEHREHDRVPRAEGGGSHRRRHSGGPRTCRASSA